MAFVYCGLDWDAWTDAAQAQFDKLATYSELSVSGNGVHAIARAAPFQSAVCKTPQLEAEAYCDKRYFAFTGRLIEGAVSTIETRPDEIAEVVALRVVRVPAARSTQLRSAVGNNVIITIYPLKHMPST